MNKQLARSDKPDLTDKQERFCQEYIVDLNATQSAVRAGYSKKTAYSIGQRLLKNVEIQEHIQQLMDARSARTEIKADVDLDRNRPDWQEVLIKDWAELGLTNTLFLAAPKLLG